MKRADELVPLSWDHHTGLTIAKRITERLADGVAPGALVDYVHLHWRRHLRDHFEKEERLLAPHLNGSPDGQELNARLFIEHKAITALVVTLEKGTDATKRQTLQDFAAMLKAHIKFEENEYFSAAERIIPPETLAELGRVLHADHQEADPRAGLP